MQLFYDICSISSLKKYLFGLIVASYVITAVGIPVYYHYCGGELEEINYLMKGTSCCDGAEDDTEEADNGCCKDENVILKSNVDFTIKDLSTYHFVKSWQNLFYLVSPFFSPTFLASDFVSSFQKFPPPELQHQLVISTSVLRV